jgi:hypothetical protein
VDGIAYFDADRDASMRSDISRERARLIQKMIDAKNKGENVTKPSMKPKVLKHCMEEEIQNID